MFRVVKDSCIFFSEEGGGYRALNFHSLRFDTCFSIAPLLLPPYFLYIFNVSIIEPQFISPGKLFRFVNTCNKNNNNRMPHTTQAGGASVGHNGSGTGAGTGTGLESRAFGGIWAETCR